MSKNDSKSKAEFSYTVEVEKIREYMQLTAKEKLQWLDAINKLNQAVYSEKNWQIIEQLKGKS